MQHQCPHSKPVHQSNPISLALVMIQGHCFRNILLSTAALLFLLCPGLFPSVWNTNIIISLILKNDTFWFYFPPQLAAASTPIFVLICKEITCVLYLYLFAKRVHMSPTVLLSILAFIKVTNEIDTAKSSGQFQSLSYFLSALHTFINCLLCVIGENTILLLIFFQERGLAVSSYLWPLNFGVLQVQSLVFHLYLLF